MKRGNGHSILFDVDAVLQRVRCTNFSGGIDSRCLGMKAFLADRELSHLDVCRCLGREMSGYQRCTRRSRIIKLLSGAGRSGAVGRCGARQSGKTCNRVVSVQELQIMLGGTLQLQTP